METIRTFIAIELAPPLRETLAGTQAALRPADASMARAVKWVDAHAIHLTLKFLGDTPSAQVDAIGRALLQATSGRAPIALNLTRAGCFPNPRQPRVLWVGVGGQLDELVALQTAVDQAVAPLGFPGEARPFAPHLTLGRLRDDATAPARQWFGAATLALRVTPTPFTASVVSFMRSELRPGGAVYTRLYAAPLLPAASADTPQTN